MGLIEKKNFDCLSTHLDNIIPENACQYRKAYAFGLGIMMNYNKQYLEQLKKDQQLLDLPSYLHLVISTEGQCPESKLERTDLMNLQRKFMNMMKAGDGGLVNQKLRENIKNTLQGNTLDYQQKMVGVDKSKFLKDEDDDENDQSREYLCQQFNSEFEHQTNFISYKSDSANSSLDEETSMLATHFQRFAKKKRIKSKEGLSKYITQQLLRFGGISNQTSLNQSQESMTLNHTEGSDEAQGDSSGIKVLCVTIACSQRMSYHQDTWDDIKSVLDDIFKIINDNKDEIKFIVALNVVNNNERIKIAKFDQIDDTIYQKHMDDVRTDSVQQIGVFGVVKVNTEDSQGLIAEQKQLKLEMNLKRIRKSVPFITKFLGIIVGVYVLILLNFSLGNFFDTNERYQDCYAAMTDYQPNRNFYLKNHECIPCNKTITNPNCQLQSNGTYAECGCEAYCWGGNVDPKYLKLSCFEFWFNIELKPEESIHHCKVIWTKQISDGFKDFYENTNQNLRLLIFLYTSTKVIGLLAYSPTLFFRCNKGPFRYYKYVQGLISVGEYTVVIWIIMTRFKFIVRVCACDYKSAYENIETATDVKSWNYIGPDQYNCVLGLNDTLNFIIIYEVVLNGILMANVFYFYNKGVSQQNNSIIQQEIKKRNDKTSVMKMSVMLESD